MIYFTIMPVVYYVLHVSFACFFSLLTMHACDFIGIGKLISGIK